jgi:RHS repeat-associated protein
VGKKKNGAMVKQWLYRNSFTPVVELDGSGNLISEFVYASKKNVPDYVVRGGATYRVISDQLGSPRYVVNVANAGDVPFTASYTSFGVVTGTGLDWMPFGFAGGIYDSETKVIRFGKRDFDPTVGRWVSKEPLRFKAGRNFYAYAWNDPVNLFDPTGLDPTGAGGASGDGGSEGAGNDPIESSDPGAPQYSSWDACFDSCMDSQGADIAGDVVLMCVPFLPTPKTPWEMSKTLGGGSGWTTWMSRASSALGMPANNALRTAGRYASTAATGAAVGAAAYYGTSAALCSAQCSQ